MQSAPATEALGVQLYFYVRCPTCGKVLANLQDDYNQLIKKADTEVRDMIPYSLDYEIKMEEYDNAMAIRFGNIMKTLSVKRECCMMRIKNPQQVPISGGIPPEGNIAISRHTPGIRRNPTVIQLTKRSKVPGGSNIAMMSITGYEETKGLSIPGGVQGIESWEKKMLHELEMAKPPSDVTSTQIMGPSVQKGPMITSIPSARSVRSVPSIQAPGPAPMAHTPVPAVPAVLSGTTFSGLVPTFETGTAVPLKKRPRLANAKTTVRSSPINLPDMMELETSRIISFDAVPPTLGSKGAFSHTREYEDRYMADSSDLMDIQNLTISADT